ncbi:IMP dehydrogenase [Nibricoccus aquaticus]|uniref:IMP dehydrogenase n=1 Tax=Nibricoccus aquaticus TaxID=2576891 RepID=A0A290Q8X4_9BACT|nr:transglutaminase family protein [Nibricoccus aquaticus]ATC64893.1 IMP dehydrogenase [Nibricoccus aquaticus]
MAIHVALHHRTSYTYDRLVTLGAQIVRLRPAPHCRTPILSYSLKIEPTGHFINWQQDPQGNYLARLVFPEKVRHFSVEVSLVAEMAVYNPFDFFLEPGAEEFPFKYDPALTAELAPYLRKDALTPKFEALFKSLNFGKQRTIDFLVAINQRLQSDIKYLIRLEPGVQTPEETLTNLSGSCRDSAWLLVQLLRHAGLAARFVSGYLIQLRADQKSLDGPSGAEKDFTDLHAWTEVFLPGAGWIGLDPTSGLLAGEGHIPLACSPEPSSAAPISGGVDECETEFGFEMSVNRIYESPRVTLPYSDEQWADIDALGEKIDKALRERDVRLTMGGEPTFISIDDMDGAEWNTAAMGPHKRRLAEQLIKRLWQHYGKGGFIHYGQGKWYPGEQLPRWAFSSIWRRDGQPLWQNPALLADIAKPLGRTATDANKYAHALAANLRVDEQWLIPGYEDSFYYLWKERRLPTNVDPLKSNLKDPLERERLSRVFEQGLDQVIGYALPLERGYVKGNPGWVSGPWFLRPETMYLIPGDSAMGFRLPLDSQPWVAPTDVRYLTPPDPLLELPPLPDREALARQYSLPGQPADPTAFAAWLREVGEGHLRPRPQSLPPSDRTPSSQESAAWITRTALCVQPREGHLFIFMPPVETTEDYLDLLAAIEATSAQLSMPVVIEGYLPPHDPRLNNIKVTPDPGVIEVNIHPSASWSELTEKTNFLYDNARECRLGTDKFMIDGRHTGTGGGNHIIIGGERPSDSPILRRPHVLKSLLSYWHQHPSLSYLFSGLFIGPTSQAPRVDEARNDILYELEIAFRELDRQQQRGHTPPWLVDRIFRNLLTDASGNTHRAEFCIDKLYSPDSATGRLGLLELRAFEMPPHARMSLAQQLLLRAFVSRFWDNPYEPTRLARWGTDLHDRFVLPHYCQQDFSDVVSDLKSWGMPFDESWFAPHFEFRFPLNGRIQHRGMELELRHALEPWHVLGEEGSAGGTVRFVDSSVERVQVKVTGLTSERYYVACNGNRVPLQPTGVNGEFVAGVRYRAWQPPSCLHPTIFADSPLVFDIFDSWNRLAVGGCTYHVAHPGGRNYNTFPVNAYEAESRRLARFFPYGHTPGQPLAVEPREVTMEHPHTLDLRDPVKLRR